MPMSSEQRERLITSYLKTKNIKMSSEEVGVNYYAARRALIQAGVLDVQPILTPDQRADVIEAYEELGSVHLAAERAKVSRWAASRALKRAGVEVTRPAPQRAMLDCPDLGKVPDAVLAKREGVSRQAIRQRRMRRGIPAYQGGE